MQKEEAMNPETTPPRVFIQKSYEDARESCWAPKVSFKRIEESDYELISKPEVEALLAEARARAWNEAVAQFKIFGTDGCITCEGGRVTLFAAQAAPKERELKIQDAANDILTRRVTLFGSDDDELEQDEIEALAEAAEKDAWIKELEFVRDSYRKTAEQLAARSAPAPAPDGERYRNALQKIEQGGNTGGWDTDCELYEEIAKNALEPR
jgi:hypothetical protein